MVAIAETQAAEIWCGAVEHLPTDRDELTDDLFAAMGQTTDPETGVIVIEISGLIDQPRWLRIAVAINEVVKTGPPGLVVMLSSRAQVARGSGVAFAALENASRAIPTAVHIMGTGCLGAAMAFASFARKVFGDSDDRPIVGGLVAKAMYGRPTKSEKQLAADIQRVLRHLAPRDRTRDYARTLVAMVHHDRITRPRAERVLKFLNHIER